MNAIRPAKVQPKATEIVKPSNGTPRSLQINIDSEDDAKAVIQHLQKIKDAFDYGVKEYQLDSVEFCIAADIRKDVDGMLMSAIRWCRTYVKQVTPFEGNVLFPLPHYRERQSSPVVHECACDAPRPKAESEVKRNRYLTPEVVAAQTQALGKSQPPVPAEVTSG